MTAKQPMSPFAAPAARPGMFRTPNGAVPGALRPPPGMVSDADLASLSCGCTGPGCSCSGATLAADTSIDVVLPASRSQSTLFGLQHVSASGPFSPTFGRTLSDLMTAFDQGGIVYGITLQNILMMQDDKKECICVCSIYITVFAGQEAETEIEVSTHTLKTNCRCEHDEDCDGACDAIFKKFTDRLAKAQKDGTRLDWGDGHFSAEAVKVLSKPRKATKCVLQA